MALGIPKWEYLVVYVDTRDNSLVVYGPNDTQTTVAGPDRFTWLADRGAEGWRLISVVGMFGPPGLRGYFERCISHCEEYNQ